NQYERNQSRLNSNRDRSNTMRAPRRGFALLPGLVVCGRCQYRMSVQYSQTRKGAPYARYACTHAAASYGESLCVGRSAPRLDAFVSGLALAALAPAALEVSLRVARELERERTKIDSLWQKRLERARYEVERAERQYHAVEPEHRLVARTLERTWEEKL